MASIRDPLLRLVYRVGYRVLQVWWLIARPKKHGVKCVLVRDDEVLLIRHTYGGRRAEWDLPGGGVKHREEPRQAARREVREELGVDLSRWRFLGELFERIDRKRDRLWCFSCEFDGQSVELDRAEIAEARWFPLEGLPEDRARYVGRILALYS